MQPQPPEEGFVPPSELDWGASEPPVSDVEVSTATLESTPPTSLVLLESFALLSVETLLSDTPVSTLVLVSDALVSDVLTSDTLVSDTLVSETLASGMLASGGVEATIFTFAQ